MQFYLEKIYLLTNKCKRTKLYQRPYLEHFKYERFSIAKQTEIYKYVFELSLYLFELKKNVLKLTRYSFYEIIGVITRFSGRRSSPTGTKTLNVHGECTPKGQMFLKSTKNHILRISE